MQVIEYLNQWCKNNKNVTESGIDLAEFWEPTRRVIAAYRPAHESFLLTTKAITEPFGSNQPTASFLIEEYRTILEDAPYSNETMAWPYYRLCAIYFFFQTLVYYLPAPSDRLLYKMNGAISHAFASIAYSWGHTAGEEHRIQSLKWRAISGRREQAGTDGREAAYLKAAKDVLKNRSRKMSLRGLHSKVVEKMKSNPTRYDNQKPYGRTEGEHLLKKNSHVDMVKT